MPVIRNDETGDIQTGSPRPGYTTVPEGTQGVYSPEYYSSRGGSSGGGASHNKNKRNWSKNPPQNKAEWAKYMAEAARTTGARANVAIVTESGIYMTTGTGAYREGIQKAVVYEGGRVYDLSPDEARVYSEMSKRGNVSVQQARAELEKRRKLEELKRQRVREEAARRERMRETQVSTALKEREQAEKDKEESPGLWRAQQPTKEERIREELEAKGIPIMPDEKIDVEEEALLKWIEASEKIEGGSGFMFGARKAGAEMFAGLGTTFYAAEQLVKRPGTTAEVITQEHEEIYRVTKESFKQWGAEFSGLKPSEKLGYVAGFLFLPKLVKTTAKARKIKLVERKPVYEGQVVNPKWIKAQATHKVKNTLPKVPGSRRIESVEIGAGEPTIKGIELGYTKPKTLEPEPGVKVQTEKITPAKETGVNMPVDATIREYTPHKKYRELTTTPYEAVTEKGRSNMLRERVIKEETYTEPTGEAVKATVETRKSIPDIKGERTKLIHELNIINPKRGGLPETMKRQKPGLQERPIIIYDSPLGRKRGPRHKPTPRTVIPTPNTLETPETMKRQKQGMQERPLIIDTSVEIERNRHRTTPRTITRTRGRQSTRTLESTIQKTDLIGEIRTQTDDRPYTPALIKLSTTKRPIRPLIPPTQTHKKSKQKRKPKRGKQYKIKDTWRIGVKGKKLKKILFGK